MFPCPICNLNCKSTWGCTRHIQETHNLKTQEKLAAWRTDFSEFRPTSFPVHDDFKEFAEPSPPSDKEADMLFDAGPIQPNSYDNDDSLSNSHSELDFQSRIEK